MIINNTREELFEKLKTGEVFKIDNILYMKVNMYSCTEKENAVDKLANAVILSNGQPIRVMSDAIVEPLRGAMLVY